MFVVGGLKTKIAELIDLLSRRGVTRQQRNTFWKVFGTWGSRPLEKTGILGKVEKADVADILD